MCIIYEKHDFWLPRQSLAPVGFLYAGFQRNDAGRITEPAVRAAVGGLAVAWLRIFFFEGKITKIATSAKHLLFFLLGFYISCKFGTFFLVPNDHRPRSSFGDDSEIPTSELRT